MTNEEQAEREVINEIEVARHALKGDIEKNTREAEEKLDKILSKRDMEFCSRCGRTVEGRMDWGGKCLNRECESLLCRDCWIARKRRFCMDHFKQVVAKKPEEEAREKVFFKGEAPEKGASSQGKEIIKPELGGLKEGREEERLREKAETLAKNYVSFLESRFKSEGVIDFSPGGFFEKPRMEARLRDDEVWIRIFTKKFLGSRDRLQIIIKPIHSDNANYLVTRIQERAKETKGKGIFSIIVLVGEKSSSQTISYVNRFDNRQVSLFLAEPGQNLVYFNDSVPLNRLYSVWLNQSKTPHNFRDVLQSLADRVSNRWVVSAGKVSDSFGYTGTRARDVLKACKFLSTVPDTDQYLFRKEKG